jgi:cysteinyl-tRNA synthetase
MDQEKMSKSLGNIFTAREALKQFPAAAIRLFMLGAHYRSPISFSGESLGQAEKGISRIRNCVNDLLAAPLTDSARYNSDDEVFLEKAHARFNAALDDDFNTAGAIGILFEVVRSINLSVSHGKSTNISFREKALDFLRHADEILGIIGLDEEPGLAADLEEEIKTLVAARNDARKNRDFAKADAIRDELASRGIVIEDTPLGTRWKRN